MSEKSVAEKILIKAGYTVLLLNEPPEYRQALGSLPLSVTVITRPAGKSDLVQLFVSSRQDLEAKLGGLKAALKPNGLLWVTYPKGTSKLKADINRDVIREYAQTVGLEAVSLVSVDDTWSALRLKVIG